VVLPAMPLVVPVLVVGDSVLVVPAPMEPIVPPVPLAPLPIVPMLPEFIDPIAPDVLPVPVTVPRRRCASRVAALPRRLELLAPFSVDERLWVVRVESVDDDPVPIEPDVPDPIEPVVV